MSKTLKRIGIYALALCCVLSCLSGCGGKGEEKIEGNVLKVGVTIPITGESATAAQEFKDAIELVMEETGGKAGSYTLDIQYIDVTTDPEKGTLALEQAIVRDGIQVKLMDWNSSVAIAMMDVCAKYKIPSFFGFGMSEEVENKIATDPEKYSYTICKAWPSYQYICAGYADYVQYMLDQGLWSGDRLTFAMIVDDSDSGQGFYSSVSRDLEAIGGELVYEEFVNPTTTDFYTIMTKIKESGADMVFGEFTNATANTNFIKQAAESNVQSLLFVNNILDTSNWYEMTGDAAQHVLTLRPKFLTEKAFDFVQRYTDKYGYAPATSAGGQAYDYMHFFMEVVAACEEKYGSVNSETLYSFGHEVLLEGGLVHSDGVFMENYKYTPETAPNPLVEEGYYYFPMLQLMDGECVCVFPEESKDGELVLPEYLR